MNDTMRTLLLMVVVLGMLTTCITHVYKMEAAEATKWESFKSQHNCRIAERDGYDVAWACDNGVVYWQRCRDCSVRTQP